MKKSLLAIGLSLTMVLAMATPAFAANQTPNVNTDGADITAPGNPEYSPTGNTQTGGMSYNEANMTSINGTDWATVNDDDNLVGAADHAGDINVWAKVVDTNTRVYKVDLAWGAMKFEYKNTSGTWDPATHTYTGGTGAHGWTEALYLEGVNNKVAVTNHSNNAINAAFAYKMEGVTFNDAVGQNNVIGNFFDTIDKAKIAARVLTNTYTDATGTTVNDAAVANKLAGPVVLATADAYNDGTAHAAGERTDDVFFAFSGTPDKGKGVALNDFKKVGVITVTVTPNNTPNLNAA